jgi:hypothetical protein
MFLQRNVATRLLFVLCRTDSFLLTKCPQRGAVGDATGLARFIGFKMRCDQCFGSSVTMTPAGSGL